ncbi:Schwann cell myelin protein-like [Corvus hawaiiensis]|uniref:Schwann cell myelin protein-like n=1 Tax=Corvus hawaiiensis TaxID=134902 RepID=UPI002019D621|nr:Schwann cell myelin protein-like [Corvus hawaiiensis]
MTQISPFFPLFPHFFNFPIFPLFPPKPPSHLRRLLGRLDAAGSGRPGRLVRGHPLPLWLPRGAAAGSVQGLWYFGSPYPKNYPPVVARSRPGAVHESFAGRARLVGDPGLRDCSLELGPPLSAELAGRYYFRGDLGGYNQYSFSEHTTLEVLEEPLLEVPPELVAGAVAELRCRVPDSFWGQKRGFRDPGPHFGDKEGDLGIQDPILGIKKGI